MAWWLSYGDLETGKFCGAVALDFECDDEEAAIREADRRGLTPGNGRRLEILAVPVPWPDMLAEIPEDKINRILHREDIPNPVRLDSQTYSCGRVHVERSE